MPLAPGTRLGPYEIVSPLGEGGMGDVYKARDTRLDRIVAIKVSKENFSDRFEREARAIAALNHPHICQLYDVGPNYLVMEYVEGAPLVGPLPPEEALRFAGEICDALDAAHRKGIVHRDLKPGNILVTRTGGTGAHGVKLLDFGLARVAATAEYATLTSVGEVMGTPAYMAPEQWEGKPADARSDIYAFGCVLHEMLTGKRVAQGRTGVSHPHLETLLDGCLARDPDDRWQSARDVKRALALPPASAPHVRQPWRERAVWATLVIALLGVAVYLGVSREPGTATPAVTRFAVYPPQDQTFSGSFFTTVGRPQFALSPDGRYLAFVASAPDARPALWLRGLNDTEPRMLPRTEQAEYPFWSPDSRAIAFFGEGQIKQIRIADELVQSLAAVAKWDPRGGTWGRDGTILFGTGNGPVYRVAETGGTPQAITSLDSSAKEGSHRWPHLLPDGRHFLVAIRGERSESSGVHVMAIDGTVKKRLVGSVSSASFVPPGFLLFVDGDSLLGRAFDMNRLELTGRSFVIAERVAVDSRGSSAVSASLEGALAYARSNLTQRGRLTWFDRAGKLLGTVGADGEYTDFRLSHDGSRLVASLVDSGTGTPDVWLTDLQRGGSNPFVRGATLDASGVWSPDDSRLAFRTNRRGATVDFYEKSAAGGGMETPMLVLDTQRADDVLSANANQTPTDWSPHGLLFSRTSPYLSEIWLLPSKQKEPVLLLRSPSLLMHATFSPSGRMIAYESNESGTLEVYAQTFPLSDWKQPISVGGGSEPRWRADGGEIYYLSNDRKLMTVEVRPGPSFSQPRPLFQTQTASGVSPLRTRYEPTRDGQRFLINTVVGDPTPTPITVVLNWQSGVSR
jgi:Tol biopolymer transport system component